MTVRAIQNDTSRAATRVQGLCSCYCESVWTRNRDTVTAPIFVCVYPGSNGVQMGSLHIVCVLHLCDDSSHSGHYAGAEGVRGTVQMRQEYRKVRQHLSRRRLRHFHKKL